jgi:hypothetical protein
LAKTTVSAILGGIEVNGIRELREAEILATFDSGNVEASITTNTMRFVGQADTRLRELFNENPLEGPTFVPVITNGSLLIDQSYWIDFSTLRHLSPVESEVTIHQDTGSPSFERRASGLTMQLLKEKGILGNSDWVKVPYIVKNRKRLLEFLNLQIQLLQVSKSIYDEVFKLVNIVSDIASGLWVTTAAAGVVALVNLTNTIIQLVLLTVQFVKLILDTQKVLFPPIRYHFGINTLNYLQKGCEFLGLKVDVGSLEWYLQRDNLCGSKYDQVGPTAVSIELDEAIKDEPLPGDGLLNPSDFGYTLGELIALIKRKYYCRAGIIDGVYHLKPFNDPFWNTAPDYIMPDVLIEEALNYSNGFQTYNYEDLVSRTLISYQKDESDYHTISDVNNRMAEVIWTATVDNELHNLLKGIDDVQIPYALCVREPEKDNLFTNFLNIEKVFNTYEETLSNIYEKFPALKAVPLPAILKKPSLFFIKKGAMVVENHFFSVPKMVWLDPVTGRIPEDFIDYVGADALWRDFHSYKSMSDGWKGAGSNQRLVFKEVKIPFGLNDWNTTIGNSSFLSPTYGEGEFDRISWSPDKDVATVDFHIFTNWIPKGLLRGDLFKLAPDVIKELNP